MTFTDIASLSIAITGSNAALEAIKGFFGRRKNNADASVALSNVMLEWQQKLMERIDSLEKAIANCQLEHSVKDEVIVSLNQRIAALEAKAIS